MKTGDLVTRWRTDAQMLERYGDTHGAQLLRVAADDLEIALKADGDELLDLAAGARESGLSVDRLRHKVASGEIANAGRKGAPRVRRADLPKKGGRSTPSTFDAAAVASSFLRGAQ